MTGANELDRPAAVTNLTSPLMCEPTKLPPTKPPRSLLRNSIIDKFNLNL